MSTSDYTQVFSALSAYHPQLAEELGFYDLPPKDYLAWTSLAVQSLPTHVQRRALEENEHKAFYPLLQKVTESTIRDYLRTSPRPRELTQLVSRTDLSDDAYEHALWVAAGHGADEARRVLFYMSHAQPERARSVAEKVASDLLENHNPTTPQSKALDVTLLAHPTASFHELHRWLGNSKQLDQYVFRLNKILSDRAIRWIIQDVSGKFGKRARDAFGYISDHPALSQDQAGALFEAGEESVDWELIARQHPDHRYDWACARTDGSAHLAVALLGEGGNDEFASRIIPVLDGWSFTAQELSRAFADMGDRCRYTLKRWLEFVDSSHASTRTPMLIMEEPGVWVAALRIDGLEADVARLFDQATTGLPAEKWQFLADLSAKGEDVSLREAVQATTRLLA